jgi:hypothetical protein
MLACLIFAITSPATTVHSQGWAFNADGARLATSMISLSTFFGTGLGLNPLMLFRD